MRGNRLLAGAFLAPGLILLTLFVVAPVIWAVSLSLTNVALAGPNAADPKFIGLANFQRLLADRDFAAAFGRSIIFVFFSAIVGQFVLGLFSALVLARPHLRGKGVFGAAILLPLVVPETVAALVWASMLQSGDLGTLNRIVGIAGVEPLSWLQQFPLQSIIVINIWRGIAFAMVIFAAAVEGIPKELQEAARVDGASGRQELWHITLPLIRYAILLYMLLTTISTFAVFGLIYFLTRGGPGGATTVLPIFIYDKGFKYFELGLGSAASVIMLGVVLGIGLFYVRALRAQI
ncbi:MAG: carbohydrate ABC transporter permease [Candidatus Limnocylindria bacterium]